MHRASSARAACFISAFLLLLEIVASGCASIVPPEISEAEESVVAGHGLKTTTVLEEGAYYPEIDARRKMVLVMNSIITEECSVPEAKALLKTVQDSPDVPGDLKIEAGYIVLMIDIIDARNRDIDTLQQKNASCINKMNEIEKGREAEEWEIKEKKARIAELLNANSELEFKFHKLQEIYLKSEKRRGLRK